MAAFEETNQHTALSGDKEGAPIGVDSGVPRESLVRTSGNMGDIQKAEREVPMVRDVLRCASLRVDV